MNRKPDPASVKDIEFWLTRGLRGYFAPVITEPLPERLAALVAKLGETKD